MSLKQRQAIAAAVLATIVMAAVILIATSGEDSTGIAPAGTTPAVTAPTAGQRPAQGTLSADLKACFEDNGVEDPEAALQHAGTPSPELTRAFQACEKYMPQGGTSTHAPGAAQPAQP